MAKDSPSEKSEGKGGGALRQARSEGRATRAAVQAIRRSGGNATVEEARIRDAVTARRTELMSQGRRRTVAAFNEGLGVRKGRRGR